MGIFPAYFRQHKLVVDKIYLISSGVKIKEVKLIRSTKRGFNFIDTKTEKRIFKKHLYPNEIVREGMTEFTFWMPKDIVINEKIKTMEKLAIEIQKEIHCLDTWISSIENGGWSTQNLESMKKRRIELKAVLYDYQNK